MLKVMIYGANGTMGQVLRKQISLTSDMETAVGIDRYVDKEDNPFPVYDNPYKYKGKTDIIIDFSHPSNLNKILDYALGKKIPLVIATTGLSEGQMEMIRDSSKEIPILYSSNMSLGVNALSTVLKELTKILKGFDIEIIEKHHNKKIDAPSGTAYLLANVINETLDNSKNFIYGREGKNAKRTENEIAIHTVRGGTIPGEHTVIFAGLDEIVELKHTALSKNIFAQGAIKAAGFIVKAKPGFYSMCDIF